MKTRRLCVQEAEPDKVPATDGDGMLDEAATGATAAPPLAW